MRDFIEGSRVVRVVLGFSGVYSVGLVLEEVEGVRGE